MTEREKPLGAQVPSGFFMPTAVVWYMKMSGQIQALPWQIGGQQPLYHLPWPGAHNCSVVGPNGRVDYGANKPAKLKGYLEAALKQKAEHGTGILVAVGGAYSNLLLAVAHTAQQYKLEAICIIRGQELASRPNERLHLLAALGAELVYATRADFRILCAAGLYTEVGAKLIGDLKSPVTFVPEGAAGPEGLIGFESMASAWAEALVGYRGVESSGEQARSLLLSLLEEHKDNRIIESHEPQLGILVPMGTGATLAGLRLVLPESIVLVGMTPFEQEYARAEVQRLLPIHMSASDLWQVYSAKSLASGAAPLGGYGRPSAQLMQILGELESTTGLGLNPLYSGLAYAMTGAFKQEIQDAYPSVQHWFLLDTGGSL